MLRLSHYMLRWLEGRAIPKKSGKRRSASAAAREIIRAAMEAENAKGLADAEKCKRDVEASAPQWQVATRQDAPTAADLDAGASRLRGLLRGAR